MLKTVNPIVFCVLQIDEETTIPSRKKEVSCQQTHHKDCSIKCRSKYSTLIPLCLLRNLMEQTLVCWEQIPDFALFGCGLVFCLRNNFQFSHLESSVKTSYSFDTYVKDLLFQGCAHMTSKNHIYFRHWICSSYFLEFIITLFK